MSWQRWQKRGHPSEITKKTLSVLGPITVGIRNPTIQNPDFLEIKFQMAQFSKGGVIAVAIALVPTI